MNKDNIWAIDTSRDIRFFRPAIVNTSLVRKVFRPIVVLALVRRK